jgi:membrane fusion protein (multidrug efflux system)
VRPQVGGIVKARLFQEGGYVRAGQALYQIDPATYQAAYNSAAAGLAQAQATATAAKLKADRYRTLVESGAVSKQDNDDAQAADPAGRRQCRRPEGRRRRRPHQPRLHQGAVADLGPHRQELGDPRRPGHRQPGRRPGHRAGLSSRIYVDLTQSSADMLKLQRDINSGKTGPRDLGPGDPEAGRRLDLSDPGRLEFSDVTVDPTTGSVGLRATFANPNGVLLPGMYVRAVLSKGVAQNGMLIPQAAVSRDPKGNATVMVVGAKGAAEPRQIVASPDGRRQVAGHLGPEARRPGHRRGPAEGPSRRAGEARRHHRSTL